MWPGPNHPYQELPPLPPAQDVETKVVLRRLLDAHQKISALNAELRHLPDPSMLINSIPLLESQASSEIENIVTTQDELFRLDAGATRDETPATKEALRYRTALRHGTDLLREGRPLSASTAVELCSLLVGHQSGVRTQVGTFIGNPVTHERTYTPPEGADVIWSHLGHWENFIHNSGDLDPLVVMALQHYQFEAIHPFSDGNGRTGRIMNVLYLQASGTLSMPVLYLSGPIVRSKQDYYARLRAVTEHGDWEGWVQYMVGVVERSASWTLTLVREVENLMGQAEAMLRTLRPRVPTEMARVIFHQPYIRIDDVVNSPLELTSRRQTAAEWLHRIAEAGLLSREHVGRQVLFVNEPLRELLYVSPLG